jgi:hypothetical protein
MVVFSVKKVFTFGKDLLKEYFMCYKTWSLCMPYKKVEIEPLDKNNWDWEIADAIDFIVLKWNFKHTFTSKQIEHENHLSIDFENSNQIKNFDGQITFQEKEFEDGIKCLVKFNINKLKLKDPLLNRLRDPFIGIMKADYKKFLDNVYDILQDTEIRGHVLEDCWWVDYKRIKY